MRCRGSGHTLKVEPTADSAGERHVLDVEHLTRFRHESVEIECPLHGRRLAGAKGRDLQRRRGDPCLLDPQPVAPGRPPTTPQPRGEGLVPAEESLLRFSRLVSCLLVCQIRTASSAGRSATGLLGFVSGIVLRCLDRRDDALHRSQIPRTGANLQHPLIAIGTGDCRELKLPARHTHVGPHGEPAGHGPRRGRKIDIGSHGKILRDQRLEPVPSAAGRHANPARCLCLEERRCHL